MNIERTAFNSMDPASPYGDAGQTVQDQIGIYWRNKDRR